MIALAHDYLTQRGGAERVVLSMARAFPDAPIYTTFYDPDGTYPEFRDLNVVPCKRNRISALRKDPRKALPILSRLADSIQIDADVTIASSSGWAHGFHTSGSKLVYCHNPARWLYQREDYFGGSAWRSPKGWLLQSMRPRLLKWDAAAAATADHYLANSNVVAQRIRDTYGIEPETLFPPVAISTDGPQEPIEAAVEWADFYLVVSRLLPYKHVDRVMAAIADTDKRLLVIGSGPQENELRALTGDQIRLVSGVSDAQIRWAYASATALIAPSHEDFGLTPIEAAAFGKPTLALRAGGYLDTVTEGVNGVFFDSVNPARIREAVLRHLPSSYDADTIRKHAESFGEQRFHDRLRQLVEEYSSGKGAGHEDDASNGDN